jgi:peptidyl-prolyl cis-trans isomerase B (cyclophilin B)
VTEPTPAYTPAPVAQKTNVLAIVSLVISILGFNIIAVILGAIALSQIKKTGESGRGLALAGIIIGAVSLVIGIVIIIVSIAIVAANTTVTTY